MPQFKTASRSFSDLNTAKQELNDIFGIVQGANKKIVPSAVRKLDENRYEIAELILTLINDTYLVTDPTPLLVDTVDGDIKNDYVWREMDSNLRVVSRGYGSKPLSQRLTFKEYSISTSMKEIAVEIPLEEIAAGSTTASQVTDAIANAILRYRIAAVLSGIDAGVTAGADRTGVAGYTLRYTGMTQANLDKAIDGLLDESDAPTVFARHIALQPAIRSFTGFSDDVTEEMFRRGVIGQYHGANVTTLKDGFSKVDNSHLIPKNRVYLAGGQKGAKWMQKDVSFLNWSMVDPRTSTFGVGTRLEDGMLMFDPYRYRIVEF
jgi:hypothetical protein